MIQLYTINIAILLSGNKRHPSLIFFFKKNSKPPIIVSPILIFHPSPSPSLSFIS